MKRSFVHFTAMRTVLVLVVAVVVVITLVVSLTGKGQNVVTPRLLDTSDLPVGWAAAGSQATSPDLPHSNCLSGLGESSGANVISASVSFSERSGLPVLGEGLATGPTVGADYVKAARALNACHSLTFAQDKRTIRATIAPLALARVGSQSAAYSLDFTISGFHIVTDIVLFKTAKYVGEVLYVDSVSPPTAAVGAFATEAADKAEGKPVTASAVSIVSVPVRVAHTSIGAVGYRVLGSGPSLILIMGYGGTMEAWDPQFVDALAEHHRVVIFDNAGVGDTHALPTPMTIDAMANQTSALIDTLGLHKPDVLGWSMGGMIAQALAVEHPSQVRRLVLCATFPGTGTVKPSQVAINALKSTNSDKVMSVLFPADQAVAKQDFETATGDYPPSSPAPKSTVTAQTNAVNVWFDARDDAGQRTAGIDMPTLVADGTVDRLDPVANDRVLASLIPKARLVLYPDAGHAFLFQEEITFIPVVRAFLDSN